MCLALKLKEKEQKKFERKKKATLGEKRVEKSRLNNSGAKHRRSENYFSNEGFVQHGNDLFRIKRKDQRPEMSMLNTTGCTWCYLQLREVYELNY